MAHNGLSTALLVASVTFFIFGGCLEQQEVLLSKGDTLLITSFGSEIPEVFSITVGETETRCSHISEERKVIFTINGEDHRSLERLIRRHYGNTLASTAMARHRAGIIILRDFEVILSHPLNESPLTDFCYELFKEPSIQERFNATFQLKHGMVNDLIRLGES